MKTVVFELLKKHHTRKGFDCGYSALNNYLKLRSGQELRKNIAFPYMMTFENENEVIGYYTLSATSVALDELPENYTKITRHKSVPAVLIGRLAIKKNLQGKGYGKLLLLNALRRISHSRGFAVMMVVVESKDKTSSAFYSQYGFMDLGSETSHMFLPYKTIQKL